MATADLGPLPGGVYAGTMSVADLYPSHIGIGGIGTQGRTLPAFAERQLAGANAAAQLGAPLEAQLIGQPAGWLLVALVVLLVLAWVTK